MAVIKVQVQQAMSTGPVLGHMHEVCTTSFPTVEALRQHILTSLVQLPEDTCKGDWFASFRSSCAAYRLSKLPDEPCKVYAVLDNERNVQLWQAAHGTYVGHLDDPAAQLSTIVELADAMRSAEPLVKSAAAGRATTARPADVVCTLKLILAQDINVTVQTLTGKRIYITTSTRHTVEQLQRMIQDKEGIPPDQQRLIFQGEQLQVEELLADYGVQDQSVLHLLLRLRGGMFHPTSGRDDMTELGAVKLTVQLVLPGGKETTVHVSNFEELQECAVEAMQPSAPGLKRRCCLRSAESAGPADEDTSFAPGSCDQPLPRAKRTKARC